MKRYILTGTPGSGKTTILRALATRGHAVVEEAATDVIAAAHAAGDPAPERWPEFVDQIVALQKRRQLEMTPAGAEMTVFRPLAGLRLDACRSPRLSDFGSAARRDAEDRGGADL